MLVISIALHLFFGAGAMCWIVAGRGDARKLTFQAGPADPTRGQREIEHRVQWARQRQQPPPDATPRRIAVTLLARVELPPCP